MSVHAGDDGSDSGTGAPAGSSGQAFSQEESEIFKHIQRDVGNFDEYERQYQEVLMSLEHDDVLEPYREEYARLHHSFLKSHEGENRLLRKCLMLQSDIYTAVSKAQAAEELSLEDHTTISTLTAEVDRVRKKSAAVRERESQLREKIDKLKQELEGLERVAHEPVEALAQEAALQSLLRVHETVLKEKEAMENKVSTVQGDIAAAERRLAKLLDSRSANDAEMRAIREVIEAKQQETESIVVQKTAKEEELRATREDLARCNAAINERQVTIDKLRDEGVKHREVIRQKISETDHLTETYQALCRQVQTVNNSLQDCNEDNDTLQRKVRDAMASLQEQQNAVVAAHKRYLKESKVVEALRRRGAVAEQKRAEAELARDELSEEAKRREADLAALEALVAADEKELASVHKEIDILHQEHLAAEGVAQRNRAWLAEKQSQLRHVEHSLNASEEHAQRQNEAIYKTAQECTAYEESMKRYAQQCANLLSEVHGYDTQLADAQQAVTATELKIKQQQEMLESVIQARNAYAKHHSELRHGLAEMNKKFELILSQIQQIKDDVIRKERDIATEEAAVTTLQRQRKDIEMHIIGLQRRAVKKNRTVDLFNDELRKLGEVLAEGVDEVARQRRRCRDVLHERDLLNSQTVQRNKELTVLFEKLHTQQSLLQRSEGIYRDRVRHVDQLEYQVTKLSRQLEQMQRFIGRLPELRLLVNNATRELNAERAKVAGLLNTSEQPLNIHPNNELAWSEPATFQLMERVRSLQRELGQRRKQLDDTEEMIQQTERQYMKAKSTVAQQPGPEVAEQLSSYQANLVKKQAQMRQMQESLAYFREQTESYRNRHDELRDRLNDMAKEYVSRREREERVEAAHARSGAANTGDGDDGAEKAPDAPLVYAGFVAPSMDATE